MNVAIYARISLDRDGDAAAINRRQLPDCTTYTTTHHHTVIETLTDNDISASKGLPRPGYNRLFQLASQSLIDGVVVYHLDRLYRRPRELEDLIDQIESTRLTILTVSGGNFDLNTSDGRAFARMIVAMAAKESEDKSRRIKRKDQELAERGLPHSRMGYGYHQDCTIDEDQALVIKEATRRILSGDTLYSVVADLNARGIKPWRAGHWTATSLRIVLTSGRIAGLRETNTHTRNPSLVSRAEWPAIITEDDLTCLRSILWSRTRGPVTRSFLLAGLLTCSKCGHRLSARSGSATSSRRYHCLKVNGGCNGLGIQASKAEAFVTDLVLHRLGHVKPRKQDLNLSRKVRADEHRLTTLAQKRFVDEAITDLEYEAARIAILDRLELNRQKLHTQTANVLVSDATDIREAWPSLTFDRQRAVLARIIETITVAPARPGRPFDPERLSAVTWKV